jgi:hypothetical protein
MKYVIGTIMILAGLALGLYLGLWVFFIGGIIKFINDVQVHPIVAGDIAWDVIRILVASTVGGVVAFLCCAAGVGVMGFSK